MRLGLTAVILATGLALLGGCAASHDGSGWQVEGLRGVRVPHPDELAGMDLRYYWYFPSVALEDGETIRRLYRLDENLYCVTSENRVITYDARIGQFKWAKALDAPPMPIFAPCHADGAMLPPNPGPHYAVNPPSDDSFDSHDLVIFCTLNEGIMLDRRTGEEIGRISFDRAGFVANAGAAYQDDLLYVGTVRDQAIGGQFHAMDMVTGLKEWGLNAYDTVSVQPQIFSDTVYVPTRGGQLVAYQTGIDEDQIWLQQVEAAFVGDFVVDRRGLFIGSRDYSVYAFDPFTGAQLWQHRCEGPVAQAVTVGRANVYAYAEGDGFYAIDLATGGEKWTRPGRGRTLAEFDGSVLLAEGGELILADTASGEIVGRAGTQGLSLFVAQAETDLAFAATPEGFICCIRPRSAGYVTPEDLRGR